MSDATSVPPSRTWSVASCRPTPQLLTEARKQALERMIAEAEGMGANAVVNVRFTTSSVAGGAAELYAYGTAVTVS